MKNEEFVKIKNQLPELRAQFVDSRHGRIPKSIGYLEALVAKAQSPEEKAAWYTLILSECSRLKNDDLTVRFLREQVRDLPDDPFALTSLACQLAHDQRARHEALTLVSKAVALAKKQDRQVKYSLTCQARIALEAEEYDVFNGSLRALIDDAANHRTEDHGFEFDFLDHADDAKVDQALVSRYRALAP